MVETSWVTLRTLQIPYLWLCNFVITIVLFTFEYFKTVAHLDSCYEVFRFFSLLKKEKQSVPFN